MLEQCKNIVNFILGTLLGVLALLMFSQVISRYIFNYSITWSEEFPRLLLVWIVFFGLVTVPFKEHLTIDLFSTKKVITVFSYLIIISVACVCIYYGFILCIKIKYQVFPVTNIPRFVQYLALPVSYSLFLLLFLKYIFDKK